MAIWFHSKVGNCSIIRSFNAYIHDVHSRTDNTLKVIFKFIKIVIVALEFTTDSLDNFISW
jgi:hypothetical protein